MRKRRRSTRRSRDERMDVKIEYSEEYIQSRIWYEYERRAIAFFENSYIFSEKNYEADFVMYEIKSGKPICTEYEIKIDHSDFLKDSEKELKHSNYSKGIECPNFFYYIAPDGVISVDEIPEHAGLIEIDQKRMRKTKRAPLLTENSIDVTDAYRKVYNKYWEWKAKEYKEIIEHGPKPRRRRSTYLKRRKKKKSE